MRLLAFYRPTTRQPVHLPGDIVKDLPETKALEPPRRSWAQISLRIVAVDDHRSLTQKPGDGPFVELLQWDVPRSRQMLTLVYFRRQHLDELRTLFEEFPHLVSLDVRWHVVSSASSWSARESLRSPLRSGIGELCFNDAPAYVSVIKNDHDAEIAISHS